MANRLKLFLLVSFLSGTLAFPAPNGPIIVFPPAPETPSPSGPVYGMPMQGSGIPAESSAIPYSPAPYPYYPSRYFAYPCYFCNTFMAYDLPYLLPIRVPRDVHFSNGILPEDSQGHVAPLYTWFSPSNVHWSNGILPEDSQGHAVR